MLIPAGPWLGGPDDPSLGPAPVALGASGGGGGETPVGEASGKGKPTVPPHPYTIWPETDKGSKKAGGKGKSKTGSSKKEGKGSSSK